MVSSILAKGKVKYKQKVKKMINYTNTFYVAFTDVKQTNNPDQFNKIASTIMIQNEEAKN